MATAERPEHSLALLAGRSRRCLTRPVTDDSAVLPTHDHEPHAEASDAHLLSRFPICNAILPEGATPIAGVFSSGILEVRDGVRK